METQNNFIGSNQDVNTVKLEQAKENTSNNENNINCDLISNPHINALNQNDQSNAQIHNPNHSNNVVHENQDEQMQLEKTPQTNISSVVGTQENNNVQDLRNIENNQTNLLNRDANQIENISEKSQNTEEKKEGDKKVFNQEYFDEFNRPKYDDIIQYENQIRQEIENNSPLVSDKLPIDYLLKEFKNTIFEGAVSDVMKKYSYIRTVRRDGNCFYRSYLFRLFEEMAMKKDSKLYNHILKVTENCKDFLERNFYQWLIVEDFHSAFINEWKLCYTLDPLNLKEYLKMLFQNKERCNYLIYFIRMFTAAYIKENRFLYEAFIDEDLDSFCQREIESVDVECDHIQMTAITNAFEYGVIVESIQDKKLETLKFPEESQNSYFVHVLFRPGHYDILYQS